MGFTLSAGRHHFVPQGYLRGFAVADDATKQFVWVYDKRPGHTPRKKSVRSIAWASAYYAQPAADDSEELNNDIETSLATTIDDKIPQILRGLTPVVGKRLQLSEENKGALAFFVGLSLTRVPSFRNGLNDFHTRVAEIELSHVLDQNPEMKATAERLGARAIAEPSGSLRPMIQVAKQIGLATLGKAWQFFVPPRDVSLVTSDNPVVFSGKAAGLTMFGPAHPKVELLINLNKHLALVCTPKAGYADMAVFELSPYEAKKFNRGVVRAARERVFADHFSLTLDGFVKKYIGEEQRLVA